MAVWIERIDEDNKLKFNIFYNPGLIELCPF